MKKSNSFKKTESWKSRNEEIRDLRTAATSEKAVDATSLERDIPQELRDPVPNALEEKKPDIPNWSESQDRGEDLAEGRDPFTQQPEMDTQIPPELIQQRAYTLYEQRGRTPEK